MSTRSLEPVTGVTLVITLLAACSGGAPQPDVSAATLGATIRNAGLRCSEALSAEPITERAGTWRVTCSDSLVYAATRAENGDVCIETILAGGFSDELILPPDPRCTPLADAR
jgi:hypothetical protein